MFRKEILFGQDNDLWVRCNKSGVHIFSVSYVDKTSESQKELNEKTCKRGSNNLFVHLFKDRTFVVLSGEQIFGPVYSDQIKTDALYKTGMNFIDFDDVHFRASTETYGMFADMLGVKPGDSFAVRRKRGVYKVDANNTVTLDGKEITAHEFAVLFSLKETLKIVKTQADKPRDFKLNIGQSNMVKKLESNRYEVKIIDKDTNNVVYKTK